MVAKTIFPITRTDEHHVDEEIAINIQPAGQNTVENAIMLKTVLVALLNDALLVSKYQP